MNRFLKLILAAENVKFDKIVFMNLFFAPEKCHQTSDYFTCEMLTRDASKIAVALLSSKKMLVKQSVVREVHHQLFYIQSASQKLSLIN